MLRFAQHDSLILSHLLAPWATRYRPLRGLNTQSVILSGKFQARRGTDACGFGKQIDPGNRRKVYSGLEAFGVQAKT
jgi:hypothetical protein